MKLKQDTRNANKGTARGREMLAKSIADLGFGRPILADKNGVIIGGNKTAAASESLGEPIVIESDGTRPIVHIRTDLDLGDRGGKARRLAYIDNRASEVGLLWDREIIAEDDSEITEEIFGSIGADAFTDADLAGMYGDANEVIAEEEETIVLKYPKELCAKVRKRLEAKANNLSSAVLILLEMEEE